MYFAGLYNLVIGFNIFESKFLEICKLDQTLFGAFKGQLCFHSDKHTITKKVIELSNETKQNAIKHYVCGFCSSHFFQETP